ncbi:MAG: hypothetical protein LBQ66_10750 [Planctomycetaceae bacterium]|jgi:hypothetical protein|nr:hypothetical protein [Planctomycetaceae bacterium]
MSNRVIVLFACLLLLLASASFCFAKSRPIGFSTSHGHLNTKNWDEIESKLNKIFLFGTLQEALEKAQGNDNFADMTARIGEIDWSQEQRKKISDYLLQMLDRILSQKGFIDSLKNNKEEIIAERIYYRDFVFEIVHAYGRVATDIDSDKIEKIWAMITCDTDFCDVLRNLMISVIAMQIKSEKSVILAKKWREQITTNKYSKYNLEVLNDVLEFHKYVKINSEKEAWELWWEHYKPEANSDDFLSDEFIRKLLVASIKFINARTKYPRSFSYDPAIPFEISQNSQDLAKKYFFTSIALQCMNVNVSNQFIETLEKSVSDLSEKIKKGNYFYCIKFFLVFVL